MPEAQRFFYDTAQVANHTTLTCAREVVPDAHFVFGSDFPYRTSGEHVVALEACGVFDGARARRRRARQCRALAAAEIRAAIVRRGAQGLLYLVIARSQATKRSSLVQLLDCFARSQ